MVHFIGLYGKETYLYLMWRWKAIACYQCLYQFLRKMITKILGLSNMKKKLIVTYIDEKNDFMEVWVLKVYNKKNGIKDIQ